MVCLSHAITATKYLLFIRHSVRIKRYMEKDRKKERERKIELENDG